MTAIVASALDLPLLAEATAARGLHLVRFSEGVAAQAAVFGCDGDCAAGIARVRALGWSGPVMLVLPPGASIAQALDQGADDAVAAPATPDEVAARLAASVRRHPTALAIGPLRIDGIDRSVTRGNRRLRLSAREFTLLLHLARACGRCVSRAELLAAVWGLGFDPGTNVVEVHVSRLRAKLDAGMDAPMLRTEKGRGYALVSGT